MSDSDESASSTEEEVSSEPSPPPVSAPTPEPVELVVRVWDLTLEELFCGKDLNWPSEIQSMCSRCAGKGKIMQPYTYRNDTDCYACQGSGKRVSVRTIKVHLPPGTPDGYEKLVKGVGWPPKDVLLKVHEKPHEYFRRQSQDLFMCLQLTFAEALCGFQKMIRTLDGREICIANPPGTVVSPGTIKCIDNEGFPQHDNGYLRGKLYVKFLVDIPALEPEVAQELALILQGNKGSNDNCEDVEDEIILKDT